MFCSQTFEVCQTSNFLDVHCTTTDMKPLNATLYGREYTTTNFPFFQLGKGP